MKIHHIEIPATLAVRLAEFRKAMKAVKKISKAPSMIHLLLPPS
jgi:hypothetical protein